ncbi:MAG: hypothetical protein ACJASL_003193 [Paraglaciecola sp.]|jgi:hypothetical protein
MTATYQNRLSNTARPFTKLIVATSALVALSFSQATLAGAWVAAKDSGYGKLSLNTYSADEFEGDSPNFGEFNSSNVTYYGEYGLGSNFALYGSVTYQWLEQQDNVGNEVTSNGLGDTEIGVRYQWQAEPFVLSTSLLVKLPYLYDENDALPRGNDQEDIEFRVLVGKSLYPYGYFGVEAGYRLRTDAPSDEYRYLLEYGIDFNENAYFRTKLDGILSANNADEISSSNEQVGNLTLLPEFDLGKVELTVGYNFGRPNKKRWGLEFTYTKEVYGENTLQGDGFQLALTRVF